MLAFLLASGGSSTASAADKPTLQLEMKAREAFAAGRYDEALQTFAKLYAETLHPVYLRNIGRCHQKMRDPQKAIDAFKDYLAKSPKTGRDKVTTEERAEIEGYIKEMEALRDSKAAAPAPLPAPVTPLPTAQPAPATAPLATPGATEPVTAAPVLTAPAPAPEETSTPVYKKWWFWTIVGVAAAGLVVGGVLVATSGGKPDCPAGTLGCM